MRGVLRVTAVSISSFAMVLGLFALSAAAKTIMVTDGGDEGDGTLRAAIEEANTNSKIGKIKIKKNVATIELESRLVYTGPQTLSVEGKGAIIHPIDGSQGSFDLFVSEGGADLKVSSLTFESGANGIFVPVPADAESEISVSLKDLVIQDCGLFGLHIDDQSENSAASIRLDVLHSTFTNNGIGELDFDGIRVDEGGIGSIDAKVVGSHVDANGGDGLELDERGDGSVQLEVVGSTFDGNGFFDAEDLDDGLDIDEADNGGIQAKIVACTFNNNFDEGLDLDEEQSGDVDVSFVLVEANDNNDEGIKIDEKFDDDGISSQGDLIVSLVQVEASGSKNEEGIALGEEGDGDLYAKIRNASAEGNDKEGIDLAESNDGDLWADLRNVLTDGNDDDGIQAEEAGVGDL